MVLRKRVNIQTGKFNVLLSNHTFKQILLFTWQMDESYLKGRILPIILIHTKLSMSKVTSVIEHTIISF